MKYLPLTVFSIISSFAASPAWASCVPETTTYASCIGQPCDSVGVTVLDKGHTSLIACLKAASDAPVLVWKAMTGTQPPTVEVPPSGAVIGKMVAAFNGTVCPSGWSPFLPANGRTIVGTGAASGLTYRNLGDNGGEERHTLVEAEMPRHTHNVDYWMASWSDNGNGGVNALAVWNDGDWSGGVARYENPNIFLGYAGGNGSGGTNGFNMMMPWVALLYCQIDN